MNDKNDATYMDDEKINIIENILKEYKKKHLGLLKKELSSFRLNVLNTDSHYQLLELLEEKINSLQELKKENYINLKELFETNKYNVGFSPLNLYDILGEETILILEDLDCEKSRLELELLYNVHYAINELNTCKNFNEVKNTLKYIVQFPFYVKDISSQMDYNLVLDGYNYFLQATIHETAKSINNNSSQWASQFKLLMKL